MKIAVTRSTSEAVKPLRELFLHEGNFQFIYNKCHDYGWADTWIFTADGIQVGYGAVWGQSKREDRDAVFEFFIIQSFRKFSDIIFTEFSSVSGALYVECQSNDILLSSMLYQYTQKINAEAILFRDHVQTEIIVKNAVFRKRNKDDNIDADSGEYVLELDGQLAGSGGLMLNYNKPYADIYMSIQENFRRKGLGSLIVQELKKEAYLMGRVPAARCNINNMASKATLMKALFY